MELQPDGIPVSPVIPPKNKLVLTHCAITNLHTTYFERSAASPSTSSRDSSHHPSASPATTSTASKSHQTNEEEEIEAGTGVLCEGAVTLYVQQEGVPTSFAVCTLSVLKGITYAPLDLLFTGKTTLTLKKSSNGGATGAHVAYPSVHLTGYYEQEVDVDEEDSESEDLHGMK